MEFTSVEFWAFIAVGLVVYYILPKCLKRFQWVVLLILSYSYYASFDCRAFFFVFFTTAVTFGAAFLIERTEDKGKAYLAARKESLTKEEKKAYKKKTKTRKKWIMLSVLILTFGQLAVVKYTNFFIENLNPLTGGKLHLVDMLVPLGISFFTFQSVSYVLDVYWGKVKAEKNIGKYALFVSFFPQTMQGPIGRFGTLAPQLCAPHKFDLTQVQFGLQRIFWGFCKKMILGDRAAVFVVEVFNNYRNYSGIYYVMAVLLYSVWLYADFSGGMDIVIGVAQTFGITMDENFKRPFFSKSIGEFWRRWHITLGTWMKDYVFYPFSLSKVFGKLSKFTKGHFGKHVGQTLPICVSNLLIFFLVGVWHGAAWKYIAYGLYNGFIIAFSSLCKPLYKKALDVCHINGEGKAWSFVKMVRTFLLVNIGWYFDMAVSFSAAVYMMIHSFDGLSPEPFVNGTIFQIGMKMSDLLIIIAGCIVWLIISILQELGKDIRVSVAAMPLPLRWVFYLMLIFAPILIGYVGAVQGFIYAQF